MKMFGDEIKKSLSLIWGDLGSGFWDLMHNAITTKQSHYR